MLVSDMSIRNAYEMDYEPIRALNDVSFGETAQSNIIAQLRASGESLGEKVHIKAEKIIAHIIFYKIKLNGRDIAAGLGPVCVHPDHQKMGYGTQIIKTGMTEINPEKRPVMFVLGHVEYYPRFGFSSELGAQYISPWPRPAFMALKRHKSAPEKGRLTFPKAYL